MKNLVLILVGINTITFAQSPLERFQAYSTAWASHDFLSEDYKSFLNDTIYIWHNRKEGDGIQSVYNPFSEWNQWAVAVNGVFWFDSVRYLPRENKITLKFNETTDFLREIGMPEGFSAIVHYWLDDGYKVKEVLFEWDPNNPDFSAHLKPIADWAIQNDSLEINELYLKNGFEPSWLNAIRWDRLLTKYRER